MIVLVDYLNNNILVAYYWTQFHSSCCHHFPGFLFIKSQQLSMSMILLLYLPSLLIYCFV